MAICEVCKVDAPLDCHHVVPRHCGGTNGPTVMICATCHRLIHAPNAPVDYWESHRCSALGFYYRNVAQAAQARYGKQRDTVKITLEIPTDLNDRLAYLAKLNRISKKDLIIQLLRGMK